MNDNTEVIEKMGIMMREMSKKIPLSGDWGKLLLSMLDRTTERALYLEEESTHLDDPAPENLAESGAIAILFSIGQISKIYDIELTRKAD